MTDRTRDALQRAYTTHCADGYIPDEDETTPQEPTSGAESDFGGDPMSACRNCGTPSHPEDPIPQHCPSCPPTRCDDCGGMSVWATGDLCSCWTSVEDLNLADLKALFADDCDGPGLSVDTTGEATSRG